MLFRLPSVTDRSLWRPLLAALCLAALLPGKHAWMASSVHPTTDEVDIGARGRAVSPPPPGRNGRAAEAVGRQYLLGDGPSAHSWLSAARNYLGRGEVEQAIWACRKLIKLQPLSAEAHFLLGVAYTRRLDQGLPGDGTDWMALAIKETETATQLDDYLPAWYNLGQLHLRNGNADAARLAWEHILLISPRSALGQRTAQSLARLNDRHTLPDALAERWP